MEDIEKRSIHHPYEQDRQRVSRFAYEDMRKFSPICSQRAGIRKISHYNIVRSLFLAKAFNEAMYSFAASFSKLTFK
jgi:hypothetical protein